VLALDDELRLAEGVMIASMVHVEMGANKHRDVVGPHAKLGQALDDVLVWRGWRHARPWRVVFRQPAINEHVLASARLYEVAPH
jgi:hypothetical protein